MLSISDVLRSVSQIVCHSSSVNTLDVSNDSKNALLFKDYTSAKISIIYFDFLYEANI